MLFLYILIFYTYNIVGGGKLERLIRIGVNYILIKRSRAIVIEHTWLSMNIIFIVFKWETLFKLIKSRIRYIK